MKKTLLTMTLLSSCCLTGCGFEVVDTGHRGLKVEFGKVDVSPLIEGFYLYNPFTSNIVELNVQEQKLENKTNCYTKDTQNVVVAYALTYYPDPTKIGELYKQFGYGWDEKIIQPAVLGSLKDVIGQYIADDLVSKREAATKTMFNELYEKLQKRSINLTNLAVTNLDFDDNYEKAVEEKVVAIQRASEAKNKTVQVQEEAKQTVEKANAEATSMKIRSAALAQNKSLVEWEAVKKWDGQLPTYMLGSGTMPFISLDKKP